MTASDEDRQGGFTVVHGVGVFVLLVAANLIVGGISSVVFGLHVAVVSSEAVILLIPLSLLSGGGYRFRDFLSYPAKVDSAFWIWLIVASVSLFVVVSDITGYVHQLVPRPKVQQEALLKFLVAKTWPEYLFRLFGFGVLAGFCEEFAFRGFLQRIFSGRLGGIKGFVLTAILFAVIHLDPWNFAGVFLLGLFLGYLVYLTGNLWVAIFVHFFSNTIAVSVGFFSPDVGSDFGYTSPAYVTLLFTFLFVVSLNSLRRVCRRQEQVNAFTG
jgi:membrane protease YdiL (CAAX protease family)